MSSTPSPARVAAPGGILRKELEARGWSQKELAAALGRPYQAVNEIVRGKKSITPDTALDLGAVLGTTAEFWLSLDMNYRLYMARQKRRAKMARG